MIKIFYCLIFLVLSFFLDSAVLAQSNSFVSVVNPIRGSDFWSLKDQDPQTAFFGQRDILKKQNIEATWLIRFDALADNKIIDSLKTTSDEKGLFLEVTPIWTKEAGVEYQISESWHSAKSAFLTGYEPYQREKLIDAAFEKFKNIFGSYPKSVGAWWIDSYSLSYMHKKYEIIDALIVADQYTTDNYQIWGQYFSTPYYPSRVNALHPAQTLENKLPVVITQWAARDPVNGYGNGVLESTYSVQANDYLDYHDLDTNYFEKLIDIYTKQKFNKFGHIVVGLENSYEWGKYAKEYENQIKKLAQKRKNNEIFISSLANFANWYKQNFPDLSPAQIIMADDPLGSEKKVVWFMNRFYRAGWFYNEAGSVFRDIRQYIDGKEELCLQKRCDEVNFATSATRVLDEVSFGHKWLIDEGKISDFRLSKEGEKYLITYENEAENSRKIEFMPRDIGVDGKILSIDTTILDAIKSDTQNFKKKNNFEKSGFNWNIGSVVSKITRFLLFILIVCLVPGFVLTNKLFMEEKILKRVFIATITGFVLITITFYVASLLNFRFLLFLYVLVNLFLFFKLKLTSTFKITIPDLKIVDLVIGLVIIIGTIFQNIPSFKNGLVFSFGMGFWGPNTHDGVWHISLINQLVKALPVQNPIFADSILKNYHFFYDLMIAQAVFFTQIPVIDLVFRFYPIVFSLLLGIGTYYLTKSKLAAIFSLYFVYFAGSFGWIVDFIKQKTFAGESAFWANQSISFNLNPPFAISLLIIIALLLMLNSKKIKSFRGIIIMVILAGSLIGFKSYAAVLFFIPLAILALINVLKKDFTLLSVLVLSFILSLVFFISNFQTNQQLVIFSPFWLIHSMVDSMDRVGWVRLSQARVAGIETNNWFKFIIAETVGLLIFIAGNLGIRILAFSSLWKIKGILKDNKQLFLFIFSVVSFLIPILFIQSGNPWNTIQFSYYGLYIAAIVGGGVAASFIIKLPKIVAIVATVLIIVITPINSITTSSYYQGYLPHARIDPQELKALEFLSKQPEGIVLTYPYNDKLKQLILEPWPLFVYDSTAYVSALSDKPVYLADEGQNQILLTDYKKRLVASRDFFGNSTRGYKFLKNSNIKYIYLPKVHKVSLGKIDNVKIIFENEEVIIYKTK